MSDSDPSTQTRRDAARAQREATERAAATSAARKRRLGIVGAIVGAVAVASAVVVLVVGGGNDTDVSVATEPVVPSSASVADVSPTGTTSTPEIAVAGRAESQAMLAGIPQSGNTLGRPDAPVTLIEFADLQCPYCRDYTLQTMPKIIQEYVRSGKVKVQVHLLTFLGPDSIRGAAVAQAAGQQDKLWNVLDLFYFNQGEEKSGYATDAFLRRLVGAVPGLDATKVFARPLTGTASAADRAADALAARYGVRGTPTFLTRAANGTLTKASGFDYDGVKAAIDTALQG